MEMQRPKSVTIIGWLTVASGAVSCFLTILFIVVLNVKPPEPETLGGQNIQYMFTGLFLLFVFSIFIIALGKYLLKLKEWARITMICLSILYIVFSILEYTPLVDASEESMLSDLAYALIFGLYIWYLTRPKIKESFNNPAD